MAASLYRDDREAIILGKYGKTECLENTVCNSLPDQPNDVTDILINTEAEE